MTKSHCIKCKKSTDSRDPTMVVSKTGKHMRKSKCVECGGGKCSFVSTKGHKGGDLAPEGQSFIPTSNVETGVNTLGDGPPQGISDLRRGMGVKKARKSKILKNFDPLHPVLPQLPELDNMQGNYPGIELPTGQAGNGFHSNAPTQDGKSSINARGPRIPPTSASTPDHGLTTYASTNGINAKARKVEKKVQLMGGFLEEAAALLEPLQGLLGSLVEPDTEARVHQYLYGSGQSDAFKMGLQSGLDRKASKGGALGQDIKDFFQGFSYGFTHPGEIVKVLGRGYKYKSHILDGLKQSKEVQMKGGDAAQDIKDFFNGFAYGFSHPKEAFDVLGKVIKEGLPPGPLTAEQKTAVANANRAAQQATLQAQHSSGSGYTDEHAFGNQEEEPQNLNTLLNISTSGKGRRMKGAGIKYL